MYHKVLNCVMWIIWRVGEYFDFHDLLLDPGLCFFNTMFIYLDRKVLTTWYYSMFYLFPFSHLNSGHKEARSKENQTSQRWKMAKWRVRKLEAERQRSIRQLWFITLYLRKLTLWPNLTNTNGQWALSLWNPKRCATAQYVNPNWFDRKQLQ